VCGNSHSRQRPQECGIGVEKCGRKVPLRHEILASVEILEDSTQQLRALNDSGFDETPLVRRNQKRYDVDTPSTTCPQGIAIDVVCNPVLANAVLGPVPTSSQLLGPESPKRFHHVGPVWSRIHAIG
jgi:hypothetical protein